LHQCRRCQGQKMHHWTTTMIRPQLRLDG
jgi:hypothetical protein